MSEANRIELSGRGILITGGTAGIGNAVARACIQAGADVMICGRNASALDRTKAELSEIASASQVVSGLPADVSNPAAVEKLIAAAAGSLPAFTGLVNCAGVLGPKGALDDVAADAWIATIQANLVGTMLTCRAALPHFRAQAYGKIVNFSGGGATSPRPRFSAYAASKAAVVRLTENLAHELQGTRIFANAIAPGAVNTRMLEEVLEAGPETAGEAAYRDALRQQAAGGTSPDTPAALCLMLLSPESDGITGRLISAVWDPWNTLPQRKQELMKTDIYTLRRIVPADRGFNWS